MSQIAAPRKSLSGAAETVAKFRIREIALHEREVRLRLPFRFGVVTLTECPQLFARVRIELADGKSGWGAAAELAAPKWFDKNLALSNDDNFDQLRLSLATARGLYLADTEARTAFGHFARHYRPQIAIAGQLGLNRLIANYGPALIDRAALDALCRLLGVSFYAAMAQNLAGLDTALSPDLQGFDLRSFLASREPAKSIAIRHTVGLVDAITAGDLKQRVKDGLPETLEEVCTTYGHRWFKLKVGGDIAADIERLSAIAAVLDRLAPGYRCTLDGNEQYETVEAVIALWERIAALPRLQTLANSVAFIEQPISRAAALTRDVRPLSNHKPVIIDESDDDIDVFPRARELGYTGISSKSCKGIYKSVLNAARAARWNEACGPVRYLISGEDLTMQAGIAVQQDLALVNFLGIEHVERNGHHYVNGLAAVGEAEQARFLAAHPDLYAHSHGAVRLAIKDGRLAIGSLACRGFAARAEPDWAAMPAMRQPRSSFTN